MSDTVALLFGAAIVLFYSYRRFNVATYEGEARLDRLVTLIAPDKLRARGTVLKAYGFYAAMFVAIYFFLCAYAEVLPALGGPTLVSETLGASQLPAEARMPADVSGFAPVSEGAVSAWAQPLSGPEQGNSGIGIASSVSLTVALIMVGLAPSFPLLTSFDEWMRSVSHRLAGIPTWVLEAANTLRPMHIGKKNLEGAKLISRTDRDRIGDLRDLAKGTSLARDEDFWNDLEVITAISAWVLDDRVRLGNANVRAKFERVERALRERKDGLIQQLDGIIRRGGFAPTTLPEQPTPPEPPSGEKDDEEPEPPTPPTSGTAQIERLVDDLAADLRILVALYVEHGVIDFAAGAPPAGSAARTSQHDQAKAALRKYAEPVRGEAAASDAGYAAAVWLWTLGVTLVIAVAWSMTFGLYETLLQRGTPRGGYWRALNYAFMAFNAYGLTLLVALAIRDGLRQRTAGWHASLARGDWPRWLPQMALVAVAAWAVTIFFMVGVSIWQSAVRLGWDTVKANLGATIEGSFEYNAPTAIRGVLLAMIVLGLLDRRQADGALRGSPQQKAREEKDRMSANEPDGNAADESAAGGRGSGASAPDRRAELRSSWLWAAAAGASMFVAGVLTRTLTVLGGTASGIDGEVSALVLYAALHSALVGFVVVFCVSEVLFFKLRPAPRVGFGSRSAR